MEISIPKFVFDKEYSTQWRREVQFLEDKGIAYTYAKKNPKYPIIRYKYTKTPELFLALAEFYNQVRNEQFFKKAEKTAETVKLPIEEGCITLKPEEMTNAEKKLMEVTEEEVIAVLDDSSTVKDDTE